MTCCVVAVERWGRGVEIKLVIKSEDILEVIQLWTGLAGGQCKQSKVILISSDQPWPLSKVPLSKVPYPRGNGIASPLSLLSTRSQADHSPRIGKIDRSKPKLAPAYPSEPNRHVVGFSGTSIK